MGGMPVGLGGEEKLGKHKCSPQVWAQTGSVVSMGQEDL